jgi:acyl transferase domain-containing protein
MQPLLRPFAERVASIRLKPPTIPYVSNLTGTWITAGQATDPAYWARHLRQPVRFAAGISELLKDENRLLLEVGPGRTLSTFAKQQGHADAGRTVGPSLPHAQDSGSDLASMLGALGRLWLAGVSVDWDQVHAGERRRRIPLPTYPFERRRYWIEPNGPARRGATSGTAVAAEAGPDDPPTNPPVSLHPRPNLLNVYAAPRDDTERTMVAIWQDLLGIEQVGIYDDFFELGGHSLLATRLVSRVRDALGRELSLETLFAAPTVAGLSQWMAEDAIRQPQTQITATRAHGEAADDELLAGLDRLSDEEVGSMLANLLADLPPEETGRR